MLAPPPRPFVLLEDRLDPGAPARLFRDPVEIVRCDAAEVADEALARLEAGLARGLHAAGFLAYELFAAFEPRLALMPRQSAGQPLLWFGLFEPPARLDPLQLDRAFAELAPPPPLRDLAVGRSRADHVAKVRRVLELIAAGDIYQANLTFPIRFRFDGDPLGLYAALRVRQPVAHGGLVALEDATILSVSPELFLEVRDGLATTRPMKGTAPRGADDAADAELRRTLRNDPKQQAENLMIVDLLRNDLSRVAEPGSVRTPALFTVESYPGFHTLTSTVTARLRPQTSLRARLAALFPCGSIVGAPKIRAAEVLAELEGEPRGVYTGALGWMAPGGDLAFNVAIRTAWLDANGQGAYGVGGGVVADSDPDGEYDEALLKGRVLTGLAEDFGLIETFRWSASEGFLRLDRHLDRLARSAAVLGFAFDREMAQARLARAALGWTGGGDRRVRLELSRSGGLGLTDEPAPPAAEPLRLCLAPVRLDEGDPHLRHKTTRREAYDLAFAEAARRGAAEAVLLNRRGRVADGSRNSLFAERAGRLATPPVAAGALPGVLRATLIESGRAFEAELAPEDLAAAEGLWIGNSLHGLRRAVLV